jgi:hypothetical protein
MIMSNKKITINNECEFDKFVCKLRDEGRITTEEADAISDYVCGIFDALSAYAFEEEDLM